MAKPCPHADMALMVKCRSPQIRSCPCSIFSGVLASLARKCDTSPEIISDLDGRSLFKVHILTTCFAASIRAVASPHRCTAKSAPVPIGGGVEMCLNLRPIFGGPAQTEDNLSGSVPFAEIRFGSAAADKRRSYPKIRGWSADGIDGFPLLPPGACDRANSSRSE